MELTKQEHWKIKRLRKGITLKQISEEINYDRSTLSKFELGKREPMKDVWDAYKNYIKNY